MKHIRNMREPGQPLYYEQVSAIRETFTASSYANSAQLAKDAEVGRSTAWRLLEKAMAAGQTATFSVRALESILPRISLTSGDYIEQFLLPFHLDERFIKQAEKAVSRGIREIAISLGSVQATKLNAIVALEVHGVA